MDSLSPPTVAPPASLHSFSSELTRNATVATLWDEYGTSYTLDLSQQEIRLSDGRWIALSLEETASAANLFQDIADVDAMANSWVSAPPPAGCQPPDGGCVEPTLAGESGDVMGIVTFQVTGIDSQTRQGGPGSSKAARGTRTLAIPTRTPRPDDGVTLMTDGFTCQDIYQAAMSRVQPYHQSRIGALSWLSISAKVGGAVGVFVTGQALTANALMWKLEYGVMGTLYASQGCGNLNATGSGGFFSGTSGGSTVYVCHTYYWAITFSNGTTKTGQSTECGWELQS